MLVDVTPEHIEELSMTMQVEDVQAAWGLQRLSPKKAITSSTEASFYCETIIKDGRVLGIYGLSKPNLLTNWACAWLLGSIYLKKHPRYFLEASRDWFSHANKEYNLTNIVDARHTRSIKWLKWLGVELFPAEIMGEDKLPFHRWEKRMKHGN